MVLDVRYCKKIGGKVAFLMLFRIFKPALTVIVITSVSCITYFNKKCNNFYLDYWESYYPKSFISHFILLPPGPAEWQSAAKAARHLGQPHKHCAVVATVEDLSMTDSLSKGSVLPPSFSRLIVMKPMRSRVKENTIFSL